MLARGDKVLSRSRGDEYPHSSRRITGLGGWRKRSRISGILRRFAVDHVTFLDDDRPLSQRVAFDYLNFFQSLAIDPSCAVNRKTGVMAYSGSSSMIVAGRLLHFIGILDRRCRRTSS